MAVNQGKGQQKPAEPQPAMPEQSTPAQETETGTGAGTTITVPSFARMMPAVGEAFEPKHLLWFGGLAAAGAIGVLEWPVVAAVGIGTYVAERFARSARR